MPEWARADFSTAHETAKPKARAKWASAARVRLFGGTRRRLRLMWRSMWRAMRHATDGAHRALAAARSRSLALVRSIGALIAAAIGALSDAAPLMARCLSRAVGRQARLFVTGFAPALADFFHVGVRPVLRSTTIRVATAVLLMGIGYGFAEMMQSGSDGAISNGPPPSTPVVTAAVTETVGAAAVPLPMPRIPHVPERARGHGDEPERKFASRPEADAVVGMVRPLTGWQPMGGEQARARARTLNAPAGIYEVQVRLLRLGYPAGRPTSTLTDSTKRAIVLFQRDMRLPMTGDIDARMVRRLRVVDESTLYLARR